MVYKTKKSCQIGSPPQKKKKNERTKKELPPTGIEPVTFAYQIYCNTSATLYH